MDLIKFAQGKNDCFQSENGIILWRIYGKDSFEPSVMIDKKGNSKVNVLVIEGEMNVRYDGHIYRIMRNGFGNFIDQPDVELCSASDNIKAFVLFAKDDYMLKIMKSNPPMPFSFIMMVRKNPLVPLTPRAAHILQHRMNLIFDNCIDEKHIFYDEMIKCAFRMFLMDIANVHVMSGGDDDDYTKNDRKKLLFIKFMKLLDDNAIEEHNIGFYASQLCITPQYLNRIVKQNSSKTVYEWISFNLMNEIIKRLENTNDTMQKIASDLNFSNQSTMEKFFKRETGYRLTEFKFKFCESKRHK